MGGTLFIGIRRRDRSEHLFETWTNPIPKWFANTEFLDDGVGVDEFIEIVTENESKGSTYSRRHTGVTYSEYGVILIDHVAKEILSCQGYTTPGRLHASWYRGMSTNIPPDNAEIITKLDRAGRLKDLEEALRFKALPGEKKDRLLELLAASRDGSLPDEMTISIVARSDLSDFEVSHTSHCGNKERQAVRDFLERNGWEARVYEDEPPLEGDEDA